jgi:hypothetical protein
MKRLVLFPVFLLSTSASAGTVAITEFINDVLGDESTDEWVEIYNYGDQAVDLAGWTLSDEGSDAADLSGVLEPGAYAILSEDPAKFVADWDVGEADVSVLLTDIGALSNSSDELILTDANGNVSWSLAYANDERGGYSTWLVETDFAVNTHGDSSAPGVVRDGFDNGSLDYLGYESNYTMADPLAWMNLTGDMGSPLTGHYDVQAQGPLLEIATGGCPGLVDLNFSGFTPNGSFGIVTADAAGTFEIPSTATSCAGAMLGVEGSVTYRGTFTADSTGKLVLSPDLASAVCGAVVQGIDFTNCQATNVSGF